MMSALEMIRQARVIRHRKLPFLHEYGPDHRCKGCGCVDQFDAKMQKACAMAEAVLEMTPVGSVIQFDGSLLIEDNK